MKKELFDIVSTVNGKLYSELELLVIMDMHKMGYDYPHISVDEVKEFWAKKGIVE